MFQGKNIRNITSYTTTKKHFSSTKSYFVSHKMVRTFIEAFRKEKSQNTSPVWEIFGAQIFIFYTI